MAKRQTPTPEIQYVAPPPIKMYSVSGDRLDRIQEACSQVGHAFSIALTALSIDVTLIVTKLTVSQLTDNQKNILILLILIFTGAFLVTGYLWYRSRNKAATIIDAIRRSDQPES